MRKMTATIETNATTIRGISSARAEVRMLLQTGQGCRDCRKPEDKHLIPETKILAMAFLRRLQDDRLRLLREKHLTSGMAMPQNLRIRR